MRVLIAHNRYRQSGGEETHVSLLEGGLRELGADVWRFERDSADLARTPRQRLVTALGLPYRPGGGGIGEALRVSSPHIVHFHNLWPFLTPAALRLARRAGAVVVLTVHNYRFACPGGLLLRDGVIHDDCVEGSSLACAFRNPRGRVIESIAYGVALEIHRRFRMLERWVDAFVAPSAFMENVLLRAGLPQRKIHRIAYGIPVHTELRPLGRSALFLGRLSPEKGVRTLLDAARLAPDVPLVVAGGGPLEGEVRGSAVEYLGQLDRRELASAIESAAYVVAPSEWYDNQPFSVIESLAAGRPVIASRMGGLPELVSHGENGLLVSPRSPSHLAEAMQRMWDDRKLAQRCSVRAFNDARARFDLMTQTRELENLYCSLIESTGRDRRRGGTVPTVSRPSAHAHAGRRPAEAKE